MPAKDACFSLIRILIALVVAPAFLTYWHTADQDGRFYISIHSNSTTTWNGIYYADTAQAVLFRKWTLGGDLVETTARGQDVSAYPSLSFYQPSSANGFRCLSLADPSSNKGQSQWCQTVKTASFWSDEAPFVSRTKSSSSSSSVHVTPLSHNNSKPNQQQHPTTPAGQALRLYPATTIWMTLNIFLAVMYWNYRVSPSAVGKTYHAMREEPWRMLTGATAHFEPWHAGVNLMSLWTLGSQQLEGRRYNSVGFFLYNGSVVVWTGLVWWGLQWYVHRHETTAANLNTPTVGYSGVLFAWMVVAALDSSVSCPIPFLPQICFHAFRIGSSFRFNWGPFVTLILMQVILPRVSWTGHLAGVIVGFALHWGLLPPLLLQPTVALPLLHYIFLQTVRGGTSDECKLNYSCLRIRTLSPLLLAHSTVLGISILSFGPWSSLSVSYGNIVLHIHLMERTVRTLGLQERHNRSFSTIRALVVSIVMVQVVDAMTLGAWTASPHLQQADSSRYYFVPYFVMAVRTAVLLSSLLYCVFKLRPSKEETGVFYYVFGYTVLVPAEAIMDAFGNVRGTGLVADSQSHWARAGPGHRLGNSTEGSSAVSHIL